MTDGVANSKWIGSTSTMNFSRDLPAADRSGNGPRDFLLMALATLACATGLTTMPLQARAQQQINELSHNRVILAIELAQRTAEINSKMTLTRDKLAPEQNTMALPITLNQSPEMAYYQISQIESGKSIYLWSDTQSTWKIEFPSGIVCSLSSTNDKEAANC